MRLGSGLPEYSYEITDSQERNQDRRKNGRGR